MRSLPSSELALSIINHSTDAIIVTDQGRNIIAVNSAFMDLSDYYEDEVIGTSCDRYLSYIKDETLQELYEHAGEASREWECGLHVINKNKETIPVQAKLLKIAGSSEYFIFYFQDITKLTACKEKLESIALYHPVTGLANRNLFQDRLQHTLSLAERNNVYVALFLLDLNRFKSINESFGFRFGDQLLKKVAERLSENTRKSDHIAHMGGDEYALVLNDMPSAQGSLTVAEKVIKALNDPFLIEDKEIFVNCSVGASVFPTDGSDSETLLKKADTALIQAKKKDNESFQFYSEGMVEELNERLKIELNLNRALVNGEFVVYYQPKVNLFSGRIDSMECLIRWVHPEDGLIFPDKFIPVAEDTDMIVPMGEWILREACLRTKQWQLKGFTNLKTAVNLSVNQVNQKNLYDVVKNILEETGLHPSSLELELTESIFATRIEDTIKMLNQLKSLGIHMSIDDFGTGYSSLSYIKRFPIDTIKIDRMFMIDVPNDSDNTAIANTIIGMARSLNLSVVAEGVEELPQIDFLKEKGCAIAQGYYFSKPVPADQFEALLEKYNK
jgi:diguanylate cyclase (GGDEF)-like protein/PAS domain S-box-containing protein